MRWYADNSELNGIRETEIPDILLFGGIAVAPHAEAPLRQAIEAVKGKYGHPRAPIKWNFKDLKTLYEKQDQAALYEQLKNSSKKWREEIFQAANTFDFTIIVACVESYSVKRKNIKDNKFALTQHVFSNGLMRLALHAQETKPDRVQVILDWPDRGDSKPFDSEYASAFSQGKTADGSVSYYSGALSNLGFMDSATYTNMHHNTLLQFADLIVGAAREFIECAYEKKEKAFGVEVLKMVSQRIRGAPNNIYGRGISVPSGNSKLRTAVEAYVNKTFSA